MSDRHHSNAPAGIPPAAAARFDYGRLAQTQLYRPSRRPPYQVLAGRGWAPEVEYLLAAGYSFLAETFAGDGCLFRGVHLAADGTFLTDEADPAADNGETGGGMAGELALVEQVMGVHFVSHELSDALHAIARPRGDARPAVAVLPAALFETRRRSGAAAVLAIGDSGLVFRYPFLTTPPRPADCRLLMIPGPVPDVLRDAAAPPAVGLPAGDRSGTELAARARLADRHLCAATPRPCPDYPTLAAARLK